MFDTILLLPVIAFEVTVLYPYKWTINLIDDGDFGN